MKKTVPLLFFVAVLLLLAGCNSGRQLTEVKDFAALKNTRQNSSAAAKKLSEFLKQRESVKPLLVSIPKGRYEFHEQDAFSRELYISNHDQDNPRKVAFIFEDLQNVTIDGNGSEFIFHGRMIPIVLINCKNVTLKNFSVDFEVPHIRQLNILTVDKAANEATAQIVPGGNYEIENNKLFFTGEGFRIAPRGAMPFREDRRMAYNRGDLSFSPKSVSEIKPGVLKINDWDPIKETSPGERFVLRSWHRPAPGIVIDYCKNTKLENIKMHYAEGMGLIAQMSENITLNGFSVCLKGKDDPRYFTTQADATHFSGCKGLILSENGLYEGMADDAINVHGTYLKIIKRINANTIQAQYMHPQSWGFLWGEVNDKVQFIASEKMELVTDDIFKIRNIKAVDKPTAFGAKIFDIELNADIPVEITETGKFAIENLTWVPEVVFRKNLVRNNRARGALFSTPEKVVCENNVFDHTHGTAILLCGDANGWYETGMCKNVVIRNNKFINALTANYQFTNAIISIYPEIPDLKNQQKYFHKNILIENNSFETFDRPVLYAKSTDGIVFKNNRITYNNEFKPFHWNKHIFFFEKVKNVRIEKNNFQNGLDKERDIRTTLSGESDVFVSR